MYRAVQQVRPRLLLAPCPSSAAGFEAATMYVCAMAYNRSTRRGPDVPGGLPGAARRPRLGTPPARPAFAEPTAVLADFDSAAAAARFSVALQSELPHQVWVERLRLGIRHQYEVHRVRVSHEYAPGVLALLGGAWQRGVRVVNDHRPTSPSSARWRHRQDLAVSVWRATLLAGRAVRTTRGLRVRMPIDLAPVVVRAARLLGLGAEVRYHPSAPVVCITDDRDARALLSRVSWRAEPRQAACVDHVPLRANAG